jgi:hypothetical protein
MADSVPNRAKRRPPVGQRMTPTARYYASKENLNFKGMEAKYGKPWACPNCLQVTFEDLEGGRECPCCDTCYDYHPYANKKKTEKACPVQNGTEGTGNFYQKR